MAKNPFNGILGKNPAAENEQTNTPAPDKVGGAVVASGPDLEEMKRQEAAKASQPVGMKSDAPGGSFTGDALAAEMAAEHVIRDEDKSRVHVLQELPNYDKRTGARLSRPFIQMYGVKEWGVISPALRAQGYIVEILHHPGK